MRTIAFSSHKGGVGRTRLLTLTALLAARSGMKVLALDLHLDAPGLSYRLLGERSTAPGLVDWARAVRVSGTVLPIGAFLVEVDAGNPATDGGWLRLMPAGGGTLREYFSNLGHLAFTKALDDGWLVGAFADLQEMAAVMGADLLLVDTPAGMTAAGQLARGVLADDVVALTRGSREDLDGTRSALRSVARLTSLRDGAPIRLHVVLARRPEATLDGALGAVPSILGCLNEPAQPVLTTLALEEIHVLREDVGGDGPSSDEVRFITGLLGLGDLVAPGSDPER